MNEEKSIPAASAAQYTPGQADVLAQLREAQAATGLSDAQFAARHLTVSPTVWYRLKAGEYPADPSAALLKLERDLRNYRLEAAQASRLLGSQPFHRLPNQQAVLDAVTICKLKPSDDPNRLVVHLAPTGGGKTTLGRQLKVQHAGILVEGRESWRRSYLAALVDISAAAGVRGLDKLAARGEHAVESELLGRLNSARRVLIIDEGEYFGPRTINLVKLLLNQTPSVVVILAIPQLFDWWQRSAWEQAKQINRRAEAITVDDRVAADDVRTFLRGAGLTLSATDGGKPAAAMQSACKVIADAANEFGSYDTVTRIVETLRRDHDAAPAPTTMADVLRAIGETKRLLNRRH